LLAYGLNNKAIASELDLSLKSVERMFCEMNHKFSDPLDLAQQQHYNQRIRLLLNLLANDYIDYQPENPMRLIQDLGSRLDETLSLACCGLSNTGIAKILSINNKTVESRFSQLFDYFNIDTKVDNNDNPRTVLFISAYCRGNTNKIKLKRFYILTQWNNLSSDPMAVIESLRLTKRTIG
jgi:DNA-binding NarL/FixJ family response regulator